MNINTDKPIMVFRQDNDYGTFYSLGLSKKEQNGNYLNGYMPCQFRKGVSLENQTKIYIIKAFLTFYLNKNKGTMPYIFISEYQTIAEDIKNTKSNSEIVRDVIEGKDPYAEFGEEVVINDSDLPF